MKDWIEVIVIGTIILGILGLFVWKGTIQYQNNEVIKITVKEKYIKNSKDSGKYLVVDTNYNTYEITDLFFKRKFNSTDIYNRLEIGQTYKVEVSGKRIHYWSMYRNINKIIE